MYSNGQKLKVARQNGIRCAAKRFGIPSSNVDGGCKKGAIKTIKTSKKEQKRPRTKGYLSKSR